MLGGGGRAACNALSVIAPIRTLCGPRTRAVAARPTATGGSRRQIVRMLRRDIARKLHPRFSSPRHPR
ncbi:MAG TPA: hypothetical protein VEH31_03400 [Streptosporangiaceae bacterium]|nr:hypothetical protein [Streptosporangiaceae bacterium]